MQNGPTNHKTTSDSHNVQQHHFPSTQTNLTDVSSFQREEQTSLNASFNPASWIAGAISSVTTSLPMAVSSHNTQKVDDSCGSVARSFHDESPFEGGGGASSFNSINSSAWGNFSGVSPIDGGSNMIDTKLPHEAAPDTVMMGNDSFTGLFRGTSAAASSTTPPAGGASFSFPNPVSVLPGLLLPTIANTQTTGNTDALGVSNPTASAGPLRDITNRSFETQKEFFGRSGVDFKSSSTGSTTNISSAGATDSIKTSVMLSL